MPQAARLQLTGITKRYPGVVANDAVSLSVAAGLNVQLHMDAGPAFGNKPYLVGGRWVDYPHVIEHEGNLFIAFAGGKQTIEVLRVKLTDVAALRMPESPLTQSPKR